MNVKKDSNMKTHTVDFFGSLVILCRVQIRTISMQTLKNLKMRRKVSKFQIYNYHYPHQRGPFMIKKNTDFLALFWYIRLKERLKSSKRAQSNILQSQYTSNQRFDVAFTNFPNHCNDLFCGFHRIFNWQRQQLPIIIYFSVFFVRSIDIMAHYRWLLFFDADANVSTANRIAAKNLKKKKKTQQKSFKHRWYDGRWQREKK